MFLTVWFLYWASGHMEVYLQGCDTVGREEIWENQPMYFYQEALHIKSSLANEYNSGQSCLK